MRLPDDYEDHGGGLTPTVISAIVAVTIFVAVILTVVLIMNRQLALPTLTEQYGCRRRILQQAESIIRQTNIRTRGTTITGDFLLRLTSDLDFWDMYPETTGNTIAVCLRLPKDNKKRKQRKLGSLDGKHTLVMTNQDWLEGRMGADHRTLPKHEYDFTGLDSCQSDLMRIVSGQN